MKKRSIKKMKVNNSRIPSIIINFITHEEMKKEINKEMEKTFNENNYEFEDLFYRNLF